MGNHSHTTSFHHIKNTQYSDSNRFCLCFASARPLSLSLLISISISLSLSPDITKISQYRDAFADLHMSRSVVEDESGVLVGDWDNMWISDEVHAALKRALAHDTPHPQHAHHTPHPQHLQHPFLSPPPSARREMSAYTPSPATAVPVPVPQNVGAAGAAGWVAAAAQDEAPLSNKALSLATIPVAVQPVHTQGSEAVVGSLALEQVSGACLPSACGVAEAKLDMVPSQGVSEAKQMVPSQALKAQPSPKSEPFEPGNSLVTARVKEAVGEARGAPLEASVQGATEMILHGPGPASLPETLQNTKQTDALEVAADDAARRGPGDDGTHDAQESTPTRDSHEVGMQESMHHESMHESMQHTIDETTTVLTQVTGDSRDNGERTLHADSPLALQGGAEDGNASQSQDVLAASEDMELDDNGSWDEDSGAEETLHTAKDSTMQSTMLSDAMHSTMRSDA